MHADVDNKLYYIRIIIASIDLPYNTLVLSINLNNKVGITNLSATYSVQLHEGEGLRQREGLVMNGTLFSSSVLISSYRFKISFGQ